MTKALPEAIKVANRAVRYKEPRAFKAAHRIHRQFRLTEELNQALIEAARKNRVAYNAMLITALTEGLKHLGPETVVRAEPPTPTPTTPPPLPIPPAPPAIVYARQPGASALTGKLSLSKIGKLIADAKSGKLGTHRKSDGGNLWIQISNGGAAVSWIFRYDGRRFGAPNELVMGLGSYPLVDIDMAREQARQYRLMLLNGKDPKGERDNAKLDAQIARGLAKTVSQVADEFFDAKLARRSAGTRAQALRWFKKYLYDTIGDWPIQKVDQNTILKECRVADLWTRRHVTGAKWQRLLSRMFELAIARGYYRGENPAGWKLLQHVLAPTADVHTGKHFKSLPYKEAGSFMEMLRAYRDPRPGRPNIRSYGSFALEMVVLTAGRPSEVRLAQWQEFDLTRGVWTVPWRHLKMGYQHKTDLCRPITTAMRAVLDEMEKRRLDPSPDALVFSGERGRGVYIGAIRESAWRAGWNFPITSHGFRSTLRDWMRSNKVFPDIYWKFQTDHVSGDKSDQAYGHDDMLEERRGMMEAYGQFCAKPYGPTGGAVVNLSDKRRRVS